MALQRKIVNNEYVYNKLEIKQSGIKGLGVFAKTDLDMDFMIPFGGLEIDSTNLRYLQRKNKLNYCAQVGNLLIDAHPTKYPKNKPRNGWVGSMVNEPSKGEFANSRLCSKDNKLFIELTDYVSKGTEIMLLYGWKNNKGGYERGTDIGAIIEQKKPKISKSTGANCKKTIKENLVAKKLKKEKLHLKMKLMLDAKKNK